MTLTSDPLWKLLHSTGKARINIRSTRLLRLRTLLAGAGRLIVTFDLLKCTLIRNYVLIFEIATLAMIPGIHSLVKKLIVQDTTSMSAMS